MKKMILAIAFLLSIFLSSCKEASANHIVISLNQSIDTIEVGSTYLDPGATAKYGLINLSVSVISNNVNTNALGIYEIIYEATHNNFIKSMKRIVTVIDETPPLIILNPGVDTIYSDESWIDAGVLVTDNSEGYITVEKIGVVLSTPGEYTITYQAIDESGNVSSKVRYVNVIGR